MDHVVLGEWLALAFLVSTVAFLRPRRGRSWRLRKEAGDHGPEVEQGSPADWSGRIEAEADRALRYGRPASVIAMRIDAQAPLAPDDRPDTDEHLRDEYLRRVATHTIRESVRLSDLVQDDDDAIRALLVETDAAGASRFVERVSQLLVPELDRPQTGIRLVAGWASTTGQTDLLAADRLAQARLEGASAGWIRSAAVWPAPDRWRGTADDAS